MTVGFRDLRELITVRDIRERLKNMRQFGNKIKNFNQLLNLFLYVQNRNVLNLIMRELV